MPTDRFRRNRHNVSQLVVHLVFTTKYRRKLFDGKMIEQLKDAFVSSCQKLDCEILEIDGEADHIHLLIGFPPKLSISKIVNSLKSTSSRRLRILNTHIQGSIWSGSYFACTAGGATIETLKAYIENQETPK